MIQPSARVHILNHEEQPAFKANHECLLLIYNNRKPLKPALFIPELKELRVAKLHSFKGDNRHDINRFYTTSLQYEIKTINKPKRCKTQSHSASEICLFLPILFDVFPYQTRSLILKRKFAHISSFENNTPVNHTRQLLKREKFTEMALQHTASSAPKK